jgi:hypothetical protein
MKRITDKDFRYVPAAKTDIRKTFARIRAEQKKAVEERNTKVTKLREAK